MSYLDNLLSGKSDLSSLSRPSTPGERSSAAGVTDRKPASNNGSARVGSAPPSSDATTALKRKATGDLTKDATKNPRTDSVPRVKDAVVSRPNSSSGLKPQAGQGIPAEKNKVSGAQSIKKPAVASKPPAPAAALLAASTRPPAKGSFAEIMARAKTNVDKSKDPGVIKHKPFEKKPASAKDQGKDAKKQNHAKDGSKSRPQKDSIKQKAGGHDKESKDEKPNRKPPPSTYHGTSRPAAPQSSYKGTAGLKSSGNSRGAQSSGMSSRKSSYPQSSRYGSRYDDYDDEDDDEDEDNYYSDESSDMEAGALDIDMEEQAALRAARAEDEAALREEQEHRRRKEELKRRRF